MQDHHKVRGIWILVGIAFASAFVINVPVSPSHGTETDTTTIQFSAFGTSNNILLDDTPSFHSPILVPEGKPITLSPGTYYWKTTGMSLVSTLTIISTVALEVGETDESEQIMNIGNVPAHVTIFGKRQPLTGAFILDPQETIQPSLDNTTTITGAQHED